MRILHTELECRLVYYDIVHGYSTDPSGQFFIKHITELENIETEKIRLKFLEEGKKQGLPNEKEQLEMLSLNGHWNKDEEETFQVQKKEIEDLRLSLKKLIIPGQIADMERMIKERESTLFQKHQERSLLLGVTREALASRRSAEFHIFNSFFTDSSLKQRLFSQEEIDNLSPDKLEFYISIYQQAHEIFIEKNFKRIAVCPFFLNSYLVSNENPYFFFGKPICYLTIYQLTLFGRGNYYKNILEESSARPPDEFYEDLDKVVQFYDRQYSILLGKRSKSS